MIDPRTYAESATTDSRSHFWHIFTDEFQRNIFAKSDYYNAKARLTVSRKGGASFTATGACQQGSRRNAASRFGWLYFPEPPLCCAFPKTSVILGLSLGPNRMCGRRGCCEDLL